MPSSLRSHLSHVDWLGAGLVLFSAIAFSAKAIFVKLAYAAGAISPTALLMLRMVCAAPLFLLIAWWAARGQARLTKRDWIGVGTLGLLGYYLASLLDFMGLQYVTAALERLVLFLYPTFVVLLSALFFGYRIVRRDVFALVVSYAGIGFVFVNDLGTQQGRILLGGTLVLLSSLSYAAYLVGAGQMVNRIGSLRFGTYASLASALAIFIHFAVAGDYRELTQPAQMWWLVIAMAIFSTVLPVILMAEGMRRIGSSNASMLGAIGPVATIFMGAIFLNEPITAVQLLGAALVMIGVMAITLKKKPAAQSAPATATAPTET
jgi:drug/metabolite transporter (DMT)-like permease